MQVFYLLQACDVCGQMGASVQAGFGLKLALVCLHHIVITSVSTMKTYQFTLKLGKITYVEYL